MKILTPTNLRERFEIEMNMKWFVEAINIGIYQKQYVGENNIRTNR